MNIISIIVALLIFNGVIIFHEYGHYIAAKKCGVKVLEFSIGFGPRLLSFRKGETKFSIKILPFGGSCAMLGEQQEDIPEEDNERAFYAAKLWKRALIIAAGPLFNILLAFIAAVGLIFAVGVDRPVVVHVEEQSPASEAGLQVGDELVFFNGNRVANSRDFNILVGSTDVPDKAVIVYRRDGKTYSTSYKTTDSTEYLAGISYSADSNAISTVAEGSAAEEAGLKEDDVLLNVGDIELSDDYKLIDCMQEHPLTDEPTTIRYQRDGKEYETVLTAKEASFRSVGFNINLQREKVSGLNIISGAKNEITYYMHAVKSSVLSLIKGKTSTAELSGPIGTVQFMGEQYAQGNQKIITILNLTILLSTMLGIMNLLPFPALDGCQLLFFLIEAIRRKPLNKKVIGTINTCGLLFLMGLMMIITLKDVLTKI